MTSSTDHQRARKRASSSPWRRAGVLALAVAPVLAVAGTAVPAGAATDPAEVATALVCDSFGLTVTELDVFSGTQQRLEVPQFDPALGTFLRAEHTFSGEAEQGLRAEIWANPARNPYRIVATTSTALTIDLAPGDLTVDLASTVDTSLVSQGTTPRNLYQAPDGFTVDLEAEATSGTVVSQDAAWVGTGTIGGDVTSLSSLNLTGGGGNYRARQATRVAAELCVRYYYLPTPEPELVSIGDRTWWDHDRDGQQGAGESAAPGVPVTLYAADGTTVVATTVTDASGWYAFTDLTPSTPYVVEFGRPAGEAVAFTEQDAGGDGGDSDADRTTGRVAVTTPAQGANSGEPERADDPTIDAGYVQLNLVIAKELTTAGPFTAGQSVTFALMPSNEGPSDALAGWSVSDVLPVGLTLTSMSGDGYTCDLATATCTSASSLASGATGGAVTVVATIDAGFTGRAHNVAYVSPSPQEVPETNPLVVPTTGTTTSTTPTDNDAEAELTVDPKPIEPTDPPTPTDSPTTAPPPAVPLPTTAPPSSPTTAPATSPAPAAATATTTVPTTKPTPPGRLPALGSAGALGMLAAAGALVLGGAVLLGRRRAATER